MFGNRVWLFGFFVVLMCGLISSCNESYIDSDTISIKPAANEKNSSQKQVVQNEDEINKLRDEVNQLTEKRDLKGLIILADKVRDKKNSEYINLLADICSSFNSYDFNSDKQYLYARECSKGVLSNNNISISVELRMIENLQGIEEYKAGLVSNTQWESDRKERIAFLLRLWKKLQDNIDRGFDCHNPENKPFSNVPVPGPYMPGISPNNIKEPEIRAKYEEAIKINRLKQEKCSFQNQLQKLDKTLPTFVENFLIQMYSVFPANMESLDKNLESFELGKDASDRIINRITSNREIKKN